MKIKIETDDIPSNHFVSVKACGQKDCKTLLKAVLPVMLPEVVNHPPPPPPPPLPIVGKEAVSRCSIYEAAALFHIMSCDLEENQNRDHGSLGICTSISQLLDSLAGGNKIPVLREIRAITGFDLGKCKELAERMTVFRQ
jgi:hypothetical protein